mmetsp:Transcript_14948/g.44591  ORF Transcript_14948/g.44591 Transcript_14948/m.44591 type:complete len:167 (+) Transcript_14948:214-714(+)
MLSGVSGRESPMALARGLVDVAFFDSCRSVRCAELEAGIRLQTALGGYAEDCREALGVALRNSECERSEECTAAKHKLGSLKLQFCTEAELLKALESETAGWHEALSTDTTRLAGFDCQSRVHSRTVVRQQMERELLELNEVASEARKAALALAAAAAAQRKLYQE